MIIIRNILFIVIVALSLSACKTVEDHIRGVRDNDTDKVTVGKVQAEIRTGMSGAEVATILGSPNIVTTDEERREVWIYDKFATESIHSSSSAGISVLFLSLLSDFSAGGVSPSSRSSSGASSKSQRTMTIIIKYDHEKKVRDFAYHSSSF